MIINVTKPSMPEFDEYCNEIRVLWENKWLTNEGRKHKELEQQLKIFLDASELMLYTNGHLALENIISAMDFPEGGEVGDGGM